MSKLKIKLVSFLLAFVFCTFSYAEPITDSEKYGLKWTNMPIVCSSLDNIQRYLDDYEFVIDKIGVGRENAKAEGRKEYDGCRAGSLFRRERAEECGGTAERSDKGNEN